MAEKRDKKPPKIVVGQKFVDMRFSGGKGGQCGRGEKESLGGGVGSLKRKKHFNRYGGGNYNKIGGGSGMKSCPPQGGIEKKQARVLWVGGKKGTGAIAKHVEKKEKGKGTVNGKIIRDNGIFNRQTKHWGS